MAGVLRGRRGLATLLTNTDPMAAVGMSRHESLNTAQQFYVKTIPAVTLEAMRQLEANVRGNKGRFLRRSAASH
jgi:hypothetical protein